MKIILFILGLTLSNLQANTFDDAVKAYKNKSYKKAYALWEKDASATALYNLAVMDAALQGKYAGLDVPAKLFTKACDLGHALACAEVGLMLDVGMIRTSKTKRAFDYYTKSAKLGDALGQNKLGDYYENKDLTQAIYWYEKAAKQNHIASANSLGLIYDDKKAYQKALFWYKKAVSQNFEELIARKKDSFLVDGRTLNHMRGMGYYVDTSIDEALMHAQFNLAYFYMHVEVFKNKEKARALYEKSALQGLDVAQHNLAVIYMNDKTSTSYKKAVYWYKKAVKQNYYNAMYNLAYLYKKGFGVKQDGLKAINLYKKVEGENKIFAFGYIAKIYYEGIGVDKDLDKALFYFKKAGKEGNLYSQLYAGDIYYDDSNYVEAFRWYYKAAKQDYHFAQYIIGKMLYESKGVKRSRSQAKVWLQKAINNKSEKALKYLHSHDFE